jgi:hypothetical protein
VDNCEDSYPSVSIRKSTPADWPTLIAGRDIESRRFLGDGDPEPNPAFCILVSGEIVGWVDCDIDRTWLLPKEVNIGYNVFPSHPSQRAREFRSTPPLRPPRSKHRVHRRDSPGRSRQRCFHRRGATTGLSAPTRPRRQRLLQDRVEAVGASTARARRIYVARPLPEGANPFCDARYVFRRTPRLCAAVQDDGGYSVVVVRSQACGDADAARVVEQSDHVGAVGDGATRDRQCWDCVDDGSGRGVRADSERSLAEQPVAGGHAFGQARVEVKTGVVTLEVYVRIVRLDCLNEHCRHDEWVRSGANVGRRDCSS